MNEPMHKQQLRVYLTQDVIEYIKYRQKTTGISLSKIVSDAVRIEMKNDGRE